MTNKTENQFIVQAILSIRPNAEFLVTDTYESLNWVSKDQEKPTETEFNDALSVVKADYDSKSYARARQQNFPNEHDLLIALWEKVMEDRSESADALQVIRTQVKSDNPKPE